MASIIDCKKCDQCGGVIYYEFNCRTDEEFAVCKNCGACYTTTLLRTESGDVVMNDTGHWQYVHEKSSGSGCIYITLKNGIGQVSSLKPNLTSEQIQEFLSVLSDEDVNAEESYLYIWNDAEKKIDVLFGPKPVLYEDVYDTDELEKGGAS